MKTCPRLLISISIFVFLSTLFVFDFAGPANASEFPNFPSGYHGVAVGASIGQFYVNFSGFIAPFASVVLTSDNIVIRATSADGSGNFYISQVLVKPGFDHFCFTAVDVKRLGESDACFTIPPVYGNYTKANIFLPPTIGLFRTEINAGSNAIIWGYSMPGATVTVHSSDGKAYTVTADASGFYQVNTLIAKAGTYDLSATAVLKQQNSEKPTNKVTLIALTLSQQVNKKISNFWQNLLTFLFNLPLGPLWLAIPILILIFILIRKLQGKPLFPTKPGFGKEQLFFDYLFKPRKLHHWWMKGVGY